MVLGLRPASVLTTLDSHAVTPYIYIERERDVSRN